MPAIQWAADRLSALRRLVSGARRICAALGWTAALSPLPGHAAERLGPPLGASDWLASDRAAWAAINQFGSRTAIVEWYRSNATVNTFLKACLSNTQQLTPDEYATVEQRKAYYDWASFMLQFGATTPHTLRQVRFFHAAATITSSALLGYVESGWASLPLPVIGIDAATRVLMAEINRRLFQLNAQVIHNLLRSWNEPRSPVPAGPHAAMSALEFDLQMVGLEQAAAEEILALSASPAAFARFNEIVRTAAWVNPALDRWSSWVAQAGLPRADFRSLHWRTAIGRALVFDIHGLSKNDFLRYMKDGTIPQDR